MKYTILLFVVLLTSCQVNESHQNDNNVATPATASDLDEMDSTQMVNSVWVYSLESTASSVLIDNIKSQGFNTAYVSISPTYLASEHQRDYQEKVLEFLEIAKNNDISIHALIGEQPTYTLPENHYKALEEVDNLLTFIDNNPDISLDGIQLDIEPHALDEWKNADEFNDGVREELVSEWLSLHEEISAKLQTSELQFSTVITWWYDSKYREGILPSGDTYLLSSVVDFIVVMAFSPALDSYKQAEDECAVIPTIVGYNREIYDSKDNIETQQNLTNSVLSGNSNYLGDSVFHLDLLLD